MSNVHIGVCTACRLHALPAAQQLPGLSAAEPVSGIGAAASGAPALSAGAAAAAAGVASTADRVAANPESEDEEISDLDA